MYTFMNSVAGDFGCSFPHLQLQLWLMKNTHQKKKKKSQKGIEVQLHKYGQDPSAPMLSCNFAEVWGQSKDFYCQPESSPCDPHTLAFLQRKQSKSEIPFLL